MPMAKSKYKSLQGRVTPAGRSQSRRQEFPTGGTAHEPALICQRA